MSFSSVKSDSGYMGPTPTKPLNQYNLVGGKVERIYTVIVYEFLLGDVEDPEIYAAEPIWKWQQTDCGKWVMNNAVESPVWHRNLEAASLSYRFAITAKLKEKDYTFWCLKWADSVASKRY